MQLRLYIYTENHMYLNISELTIHKDKDKDIIDLDVKQYL